MPTQAENKTISDLVKFEEEQRFSREVVTIPAGTTVAIGTLLKPGSGGTFVPVLAADTAVSSISLAAVTAATVPTKIPVLARMATLVDTGIAYPLGATAPQKAALKAAVLAMSAGTIRIATEEVFP